MNTASRWSSPGVVISGTDRFESHDRISSAASTLPRRAGLSNTEGAARCAGFVRGLPPAPTTRTPFELVWHMTGVIGYARTLLHGGDFEPPRLGSFAEEIARFHDTLAALSARLRRRRVDGAHHRRAVPAGAALRCHDACRPARDAATGAWLAGTVGEFHFRQGQWGQPRQRAAAACRAR